MRNGSGKFEQNLGRQYAKMMTEAKSASAIHDRSPENILKNLDAISMMNKLNLVFHGGKNRQFAGCH